MKSVANDIGFHSACDSHNSILFPTGCLKRFLGRLSCMVNFLSECPHDFVIVTSDTFWKVDVIGLMPRISPFHHPLYENMDGDHGVSLSLLPITHSCTRMSAASFSCFSESAKGAVQSIINGE